MSESSIVEFHPFTFDLETLVLRRRGKIVKLGPQPRKVLKLLVARAGDVVTDDEIRHALWGTNPNVDAEAGIYSCVARLRAALADAHGSETFIQRVSGDAAGYCFAIDRGEPVSPVPASKPTGRGGDRWPGVFALIWLAGVATVVILAFRSRPPSTDLEHASTIVRFVVSDADVTGSPTWNVPSIGISRSGDRVVFASAEPDSASSTATRLWSRRLDGTASRPVGGTDGADNPFLSPDGEWIAYFARTQLWKVPVGGGRRSLLSAASAPRGGDWLDDEHIVFAPGTEGGLFTVRARAGAEPEPLTELDALAGERTHRWPHVLPAGRGVVYTVGNQFISTFDDADIAVLDLRSGEQKVVLRGGTYPAYSAAHLLFARAGALYAVRFDLERLETSGEPFVVIEDLKMFPDSGGAQYAVSHTAVLSYATGGPVSRASRLSTIDRSGQKTPVDLETGSYQDVAVSPGGRRIVLERDGANAHLWLVDLESPKPIKLTEAWSNQLPSWAPSGAAVTYFSSRRDGFHVLTTDWITGVTETLLVSSKPTVPTGWDPDGARLLFDQQDPQTGWDIWQRNSADGARHAVVRSPAAERYGVFSPDGRSIAYQSDESGRFEIYTRGRDPYSPPQRVSETGGRFPRWTSHRELIYLSGDTILRHDLDAHTSKPWYVSNTRVVDIDALDDGERLFILEDVDRASHVSRVVVLSPWLSSGTTAQHSGRR